MIINKFRKLVLIEFPGLEGVDSDADRVSCIH